MKTDFKSTCRTSINAPIETVWQALVNPELVKKYFFGTVLETTWKIGSEIFWTGEYEGNIYKERGIVLEYLPHEKITYSYFSSWSGLEDKPENHLWICYELNKVKNETELVITQSNYDQEKANHSSANWEKVIDGLKKIVE